MSINNNNNFIALPTDLRIEIFSYLSLEDRNKMSLVCKVFLQDANRELVLKNTLCNTNQILANHLFTFHHGWKPAYIGFKNLKEEQKKKQKEKEEQQLREGFYRLANLPSTYIILW